MLGCPSKVNLAFVNTPRELTASSPCSGTSSTPTRASSWWWSSYRARHLFMVRVKLGILYLNKSIKFLIISDFVLMCEALTFYKEQKQIRENCYSCRLFITLFEPEGWSLISPYHCNHILLQLQTRLPTSACCVTACWTSFTASVSALVVNRKTQNEALNSV